jgi:hypothetical protein
MNKKKAPPLKVWIRTPGGDPDHDVSITLTEYEAQLLTQYQGMATSDDPEEREAGRRLLREVAERLAAGVATDVAAYVQRQNAARQPRPASRVELRDRIKDVMGEAKRDGRSFKQFLQSWLVEPVNGLRIEETTTGYLVVDEDCTPEEPGRGYAERTLTNFWGEAG